VKNILNFKRYDPENEYKEDYRREINLGVVKKSKPYKALIAMGFKDVTSHQQELNNTIKFIRTDNIEKEPGHDTPFYTIHPSGTIRRYNPIKGEETPEGSGNDLKKFRPFLNAKDYLKGVKWLKAYLTRKETRGDFR